MSEKQAHLNGAYYGPSIPPKSQSYHRPGRGGDPLGCCCSCIFGLIFKLIMTAVVIVGLAFFIFWLIVRPNRIKFHVTEAHLTQFNFSNDNTLHYNLALNLTIRNPNKKIGVYYDRIEARAIYEDQRFSTFTSTTGFYQGHKKTNVVNPVFQGQQVIPGTTVLSKYNEQKSSGVYDIDVKLYLRVRFKFGLIKTGKFKPRVKCGLKVPLTQNGNSGGTFETTKCDVDYFKSI